MSDQKFEIIYDSDLEWRQAQFLKKLLIPNPSEVFRSLQDKSININHIYKKYKYGEYNAIQIICAEMVERKEKDIESYKRDKEDYILTAKIILESNINLRYQDPFYNCQAIDHVLFTEEIELIELTLNKYEEQRIPFKNNDLLSSLLIFNLVEEDCEDREHIKIIELLLDKNIDLNTLDYDTGEPPIYLAAKYKSKEIVSLLLNRVKNDDIDLDYFVDSSGKSSRNLIMKYNLYDGSLPKINECRYHLLYKNLKDKNSSEFIKQYREEIMSDDKKHAFLLRAVQLGVEEIVEYMLNEIPNFNNYEILLLMACVKGFFQVVKLLLEMRENNIHYDINLVRRIVKAAHKKKNKFMDHNQCLELILEAKLEVENKIDLNLVDKDCKTVLEYAIERKHFKMILTILKYGASLNTKLSCLVLDIDPQLVQNHFDNCVTTYMDDENVHKKRKHRSINQKQCSYSIDFTSILPPKPNHEYKSGAWKYKPEMSVLEHISNDAEYSKLLLHPLVLVFIAMKWHKVRYHFFFDVFLYLLFTLLLNVYIFIPDLNLYMCLFIFIITGILWEFIQITIFWRLYFRNFDNWLKILVLLFSGLIIIFQPFEHHLESFLFQIKAISSLVSFINFFFLIGNIPTLSTSVIMIRTVYTTLFKSFLTYSPLYIAFITSFYIFFKDEYALYFRNYWLAIFKTILMSAGEYDSVSFNFDQYPVSYSIVVLFVLMISIGLLNLLTGLAVSDIQYIKSNAELYGLDTRIRQIAKMERIFLKSSLTKFCICFKSICLFPNADPIVEIDSDKKTITIGGSYDVSAVFPTDDKILNVLKGRRKLFKEDDS